MTGDEGGVRELPAECRRRYRVERTLGSGGFGTALLARDLELNRPVVIKLLDRELAQQADAVARFSREARLTAQIAHENVVKVLDHGISDGTPWIVYEFVEGRPLRERMVAGALPAPLAIEIALQVARALEAAHAAGILHRDVKPENVIEETGGRHRLIDFGIAKAENRAHATMNTRPGIVLGSPLYLSPEAILGDPMDGRSDLYALGVMLHEMIAGRTPFAGDTTVAILEAHLNEPPPLVSARVPSAPPELDAVLARLLAKKPAKRFASASELVTALAGLTPSMLAATKKPSRPVKGWVSGAATIAVNAPAATSRGTASPTIALLARGRLRSVPAAIAMGAALLIAAGLAGLVVGRQGRREVAVPPSAPSPTGLDPVRFARMEKQAAAIGARISGRTKERLQSFDRVARSVSREHCRDAAADYRWLDEAMAKLEEEFQMGLAPRDRVLALDILAKRFIQRAVLEDAKFEMRLHSMVEVDEPLYNALDDGQGGKTLRWFSDYTRAVAPALDAMAASDALFELTPKAIWQLNEVCRSMLAYRRMAAFDTRYPEHAQKMLGELAARSARPGRIATLAKLGQMAWRHGEQGLLLPKMQASHREAKALLEGNPHVPPAMAAQLLEHPFSPN